MVAWHLPTRSAISPGFAPFAYISSIIRRSSSFKHSYFIASPPFLRKKISASELISSFAHNNKLHGVFVSMGKPIANYRSGEYNKKMIPLSVVMDERICTGHEYALFWASVRRYLKHPELLEGKPTEENAYPAEECV